MNKTVIQKLITDLKEINNRNIEFTTEGFITILQNSLNEEREQIINAFNEGEKYGSSPLRTFDYPASRYYEYTYNNPEYNIS